MAQSRIKKVLMVVGVLSLAGLFMACQSQEKGTAQKAGEKIDQQVQNAKKTIDDAATSIRNSLDMNEGPMEETGEKIDQIAQNAKEKLNQLAEEVKSGGEGTAEQAGEKIDKVVQDTKQQLQDLVKKDE